jgi:hypothetical protein
MREFIVTMAATTALVACGTIGCAEAAQPGAGASRSTADARAICLGGRLKRRETH